MRLGMLFLFPGIIIIITQNFIPGAEASINSGTLILNSGEVLEIDTTAPSIVKANCNICNYTASHERRSSSQSGYSHIVPAAIIQFSGDIEFRSGSTVKVSGKFALSITSQNGHILIQTDINMTCGEKLLDGTCLGGFTQASKAKTITGPTQEKLFTGLGPGVLTLKERDFNVETTCMPGSSHGGRAPNLSFKEYLDPGPAYDKQSKTSLLGGSGGSCLKKTGSVAGGGAIELVADNAWITINASIRASAQTETDDSQICSGGSGGLIRLKAQKVTIREQGRLNVDGGSAQQYPVTYDLGGGAGGVIQIISPEGSLDTGISSLKPGVKSGTCDHAESGYIFVPAKNVSKKYNTFPDAGPYSWSQSPSATSISPSITATTIQQNPGTLKERVKLLMQEVELIRTSLSAGGEVNKSAIREVLTTHKSLASTETSLTTVIQDLCMGIFNKYQAIEMAIAERDPDFLEESLQNILDAASQCIHERNHAVWKINRQMPNMMQALEEVFIATVRGNFSPEINYTLVTTNAVVQVVRKRSTAHMEGIKIPDYLEINEYSWNKVSDFVLIPKETANKAEGNYTYVFLLYKDVENGLPNNVTSVDEWKVSSFVISCFLMFDDEPVQKLSPPAFLTLTTSAVEKSERQCSYWDVHYGVWSIDGVEELESNSSSTQTVCKIEHFTSFAVLVQHKKISFSPIDKLALSIITYIGCGVSTAALIVTFIILLSIESLSSERHKIHMNLVLALLLAQVLFLAGIKETSSKVLCKIIAVFLHYFFLTAFTWMLVEGLHLYLKVVQVFKTENVKMLYYYVFGWGFSIIPVSITAALKPNSYGNKDFCWLSMEDGTVWAFIGPIIAIITINSFVLFRVVQTVVSSASTVKNSEHAHVKAGIKGLFVLMPILGVGWILGLFAVNENTIVFHYAFAIVNGFQGLLIFLLHCVFNNEVRQAFRRQREKNALSRENDSQYHASFSLSQSGSYGSKKISSSTSLEKIKARVPFKQKKTTKLVQVKPLSESRDISESSLQVKRTFQEKNTNRLGVTEIGNEMSSLNCPIMEDEERAPPKITHTSHQSTAKKKHSRH